MNREIRSGWTTPIALAVLAFGTVLAGLGAHNTTKAGRLAGELHLFVQGIAQSDANLDAAVLDVRLGQAANFDSLVEALTTSETSIGMLQQAIDQGDGFVADTRLRGEFEQLVRLAAEKHALLERFKSKSAILGNSQLYIPASAARAVGEAADANVGRKVAQRLLSAIILGLDSAQSRKRDDTPEEVWAELELELGRSSANQRALRELTTLRRHIENAWTFRHETDELMDQALGIPIGRQIQQLRLALRSSQSCAVSTGSIYSDVLLFVVGALLAVSAHSWTRLQRRHRLIRDDNELLEARIKERTEDLERASRAKSDFVANMSHEIRTPMTAILGYADVLREAEINPSERSEAIDSIHRNGQFLLAVLNDILDLSKIESGHMTVEQLEVDPSQPLANVEEMMAPRAERLGLDLRSSGRTVSPAPSTQIRSAGRRSSSIWSAML